MANKYTITSLVLIPLYCLSAVDNSMLETRIWILADYYRYWLILAVVVLLVILVTVKIWKGRQNI